jgi:pyruvate formate lyase activating enzyme
LHQKYTGIPNNKILSNLQQLINTKADVCVRIPVVPTVNDSDEELKAIAQILKNTGVSKYELLSFHQYGKGKYISCGIDYEFDEQESLPAEKMKQLSACFDRYMENKL